MIIKAVKTVTLFALACVAMPVGLLYGTLLAIAYTAQRPRMWKREVYEAARSMSKVLSILAAELLNRACITKQGRKFGTHSVSAVLGANDKEGTLRPIGQLLVTTLDSIEPRHCELAAMRAGL